MIQLANEPTEGRTGHRQNPGDGKGSAFDNARGRTGHAWPFLSRAPARPVQNDSKKNPTASSGS